MQEPVFRRLLPKEATQQVFRIKVRDKATVVF